MKPVKHYQLRPQPIDVIESWGLNFSLGCVLKYVARCDLKGSPIEDLEKAMDYLGREIQRRKDLKTQTEVRHETYNDFNPC